MRRITPTHDLELAAIVFVLKIWRHHLYGEKCRMFTNHKSLKYLMIQKELNLRQRRWLELIKDYELVIDYHPEKANVVTDALSRKSLFALRAMNTRMALSNGGSILAELRARPMFLQEICGAQKDDNDLQAKRVQCESNVESDIQISPDGCLMFRDRVCVPRDDELIRKILHEAHSGCFMKKEIPEFVSRYLSCQQMKAEHQVPSGLLQPIMVFEWKWDMITMDFVTGLPLTSKKKDAVWVVVDRLTKSTHFIPIRDLHHGFGKKLQESLGTKLSFSTGFHSQTDGQSERLVQILEDMFRCCVLEFRGNWEKYLSLVEFAYNNSFQSSLKMAPYEALYGQKMSRFGRKGKLSLRFIRPYEITERIGPVAYCLALPSELEKIHDVFHVSMLRRYHSDPSYVILPSEVEIQSDMAYGKEPIKILAREVKQLRNNRISLVKVLW
ncbi:DNA/RNA polymerases superfamily protein [Gossypium australe]|uniref:DNA/RNA polymerases superfamily protein n=1 Tax=Gossypium australe TaxID=47621 RepID=A0A5B6WGK8_9ROSI|nr:DNA/RNA polymerases superfamily protein [Gossypium australe]